ncbi:MAG: hypothetical protein ACFWUG_04570 [Rahnella inusitata]|jgi:hypothetical protein
MKNSVTHSAGHTKACNKSFVKVLFLEVLLSIGSTAYILNS